jgi:hypothetical protein
LGIIDYFNTHFTFKYPMDKLYFNNHPLYDLIEPITKLVIKRNNNFIDYVSDKNGLSVYNSFKKDNFIDTIIKNTSKRTIYFFQKNIIFNNSEFIIEPKFTGFFTLDMAMEFDGFLNNLPLNNLPNMVRIATHDGIKIYVLEQYEKNDNNN